MWRLCKPAEGITHRKHCTFFILLSLSSFHSSFCLSSALSHLLVSPAFNPFSIPTSATPLAAALPHPSPFAFFLSIHMCIFENRRARGRWIETLGSVLVVFCVFNLLYQRLVLGGRARRRCKDNAIKCGLPR